MPTEVSEPLAQRNHISSLGADHIAVINKIRIVSKEEIGINN